MTLAGDFDATYGYDLEALLAIEAPRAPEDFAEFWRATHELASEIPLRLSMREIQSSGESRVWELEFDTWGGFRTGAWLTIPRDGEVERGLVVGHGYGGRDGPDSNVPASHAAAIFPCARGFHRSAAPEFPSTAANHVLVGIAQRETYVHRACAAELWASARALTAAVPETRGCIDYIGGSFGGGIGALMLPWEPAFRRAALTVPSFGHHPLRVTLPCVGSGQSIRRHYLERPEVLDVLAYFDAAIAARWLSIPVLFSCALFDPAVPPPGQFAIYTAAPDPKRLCVRRAAHGSYPTDPEDEATLAHELGDWFTR